MAENSIFWTTGSTGDGASSYTQSELVENWLRYTFNAGGEATEGVLRNVLNELEVTGTSSPVSVDTGAAYVYGFPYWNTASEDVAVPTPTSNTRIDLIVLEADWTAQTVRITRVAGTEGAGAPSLTQSAGSTWQLKLAEASITTGGTITVTDSRGFAHFATAVKTSMIDDDAVDDTKAGNRVPQFYRRQGGDAGDWSDPGTTARTPGAVRMQSGVRASGTVGNATTETVSVTFPTAFDDVPTVQLTPAESSSDSATWAIRAENITASGFDIKIRHNVSSASVNVHWLAIGTE